MIFIHRTAKRSFFGLENEMDLKLKIVSVKYLFNYKDTRYWARWLHCNIRF